jgi:hypothetical protein
MPKRPPKKGYAFDSAKDGLHWHPTLRPYDLYYEQINERWRSQDAPANDLNSGMDRLLDCQDDVTRERWAEVVDALNAAIDGKDEKALAEAIATATRGLQVMDAKAQAAGFKPAPGHVMLIEIDGSPEPFRFGVAPNHSEAVAAKNRHPRAVIWTMRQVAAMAKAAMEANPIGEVIETFPRAEFRKIEKLPADFYERGGDELTF